ncbi:MAG: putative baseplate assembly protein [candidate division KSB1 bacterium]|nr:putative baseplate assembly protein [candidate division KSB1 bacterium]MDZ7408211.1 putative baseplate assembly protein [candidate division KSB1 bacterium]
MAALDVISNQLLAIQVADEKGFRDLSSRLQLGEPIEIFGDNPRPGATLYLGFCRSLPPGVPVSLFFTFSHSRSGIEERQRLIAEIRARKKACAPPRLPDKCQPPLPLSLKEQTEETPPHHSVYTVWEFFNEQEEWQRLDPTAGEVEDDTRAFTLNGRVLVKIPVAMGKKSKSDFYYLRCRFVAGAYEAPPIMQNITLNGVEVEQATPVGVVKWTIARAVAAEGLEPAPGESVGLLLQFNAQGEISQLAFVRDNETLPTFMVLEYKKASVTQTGELSIAAELLGYGAGTPQQQFTLSEKPVQESGFGLFTLEQEGWRIWTLRPDFDASSRSDPHFLLDATQGLVTFGDGEKGRVLPKDVPVFVTYRATRAEAGNLPKKTIVKLVDSVHNRALLKNDFDRAKRELVVTNPLAAAGGAAAETVTQAAGRALEWLQKPQRAVTLADYETLAKETPGVQLARVSARPNIHPNFPCCKAPGIITLIVLPYLPRARPMPSRELRQTVAAYLNRRRVIGTRVEVVGPQYLKIAVRAQVRACVGINISELRQKIIAALNLFFHPLEGGPDGNGWPFGREVYRSEVLQVIDETEGVDHVLSLELIAADGEPQCGNICLGPFGLVEAGQHQIEVVGSFRGSIGPRRRSCNDWL